MVTVEISHVSNLDLALQKLALYEEDVSSYYVDNIS